MRLAWSSALFFGPAFNELVYGVRYPDNDRPFLRHAETAAVVLMFSEAVVPGHGVLTFTPTRAPGAALEVRFDAGVADLAEVTDGCRCGVAPLQLLGRVPAQGIEHVLCVHRFFRACVRAYWRRWSRKGSRSSPVFSSSLIGFSSRRLKSFSWLWGLPGLGPGHD